MLRSVKRALETSRHRGRDGPEQALAINADDHKDGGAGGAGGGAYCLDYTEIMGRGLGRYGEWGALFCIIMSQYGSAIAYVAHPVTNATAGSGADSLSRSM